MEPDKPDKLEKTDVETTTDVGLVERLRAGAKEDLALIKEKTSKDSLKDELENLKQPTRTQIYKSMFRVKHEPTPRSR